MNIKETIKALLQTKFGGVQLSDARVEAFAKRLEGKVKDEAELEAKLVLLDEAIPFTDIAKDDDRVRSQQAELEKLKKPTPPPTPTPALAPSDEIPEWAKVLIEGQKAMTETVSALKGEKVVADRKTTILGKLEGATEDYKAKVIRDFGYMNFADENAFGEFLGHVETDFASFKQTQAESKLGNDAPLKGITDSSGQVSDATVESIVNNL